jgi:hypothetical protein
MARVGLAYRPVKAQTFPARANPAFQSICKYLVIQHSMGDHLVAPDLGLMLAVAYFPFQFGLPKST